MNAIARALHTRVADSRRVDDYYAPLGEWCSARVAARAEGDGRAFVLGLQGPQGCGKSTLAAALTLALGDVGVRAATVSIDDFYLTRREQRALAARHPGNPSLLHRGYPGTHDVALGLRQIETIAALRSGEPTLVAVYDKSGHEGRGDRAPRSAWRRVSGPVDLLIVEGWMLGFSPVDEATIEPALRAPNALLAAYAAWHRKLDAFVLLSLDPRDSLDTIVRWRVNAERARRDEGAGALSDEGARDYIERFLPAYRVYNPRLVAHPPCEDASRVRSGHASSLRCSSGGQRSSTSVDNSSRAICRSACCDTTPHGTRFLTCVRSCELRRQCGVLRFSSKSRFASCSCFTYRPAGPSPWGQSSSTR
jgi:D-glycerate 3-kinase